MRERGPAPRSAGSAIDPVPTRSGTALALPVLALPVLASNVAEHGTLAIPQGPIPTRRRVAAGLEAEPGDGSPGGRAYDPDAPRTCPVIWGRAPSVSMAGLGPGRSR